VRLERDMRFNFGTKLVIGWSEAPHASRPFRSEYARDGSAQPVPLSCSNSELPSACTCQAIEARASIVVRRTPLCAYPASFLEALQGRVERAMVNEQSPTRLSVNGASDPLTVLLAECQNAQNQKIQRSLQKRDSIPIVLGRHST